MILDTTIIISLQRETRKGIYGVATKFFERLDTQSLYITPTIVGEFACGKSIASRELCNRILRLYSVLPITDEVSWQYATIYRDLSAKGTLIGTNDLWIAAVGLAHGQAIATGNVKEFQRVHGLEVISTCS